MQRTVACRHPQPDHLAGQPNPLTRARRHGACARSAAQPSAIDQPRCRGCLWCQSLSQPGRLVGGFDRPTPASHGALDRHPLGRICGGHARTRLTARRRVAVRCTRSLHRLVGPAVFLARGLAAVFSLGAPAQCSAHLARPLPRGSARCARPSHPSTCGACQHLPRCRPP